MWQRLVIVRWFLDYSLFSGDECVKGAISHVANIRVGGHKGLNFQLSQHFPYWNKEYII